MAPRFRSVVKGCRLDASWEVDGPRAARRALQTEINGVRDSVLRQLNDALSNPLLFVSRADQLRSAVEGTPLRSLEQSVFEHLQAEVAFGGDATVARSLRDSVEDRVAAERRGIELGLVNEPRNRNLLLKRYDESVQGANVADLVQSKLSCALHGVAVSEVVQSSPTVDMDGDLITGEALR